VSDREKADEVVDDVTAALGECRCAVCIDSRDPSVPRGSLPREPFAWFTVCAKCGNKRCPHASDHRNACTGSNEPGQQGSFTKRIDWARIKP